MKYTMNSKDQVNFYDINNGELFIVGTTIFMKVPGGAYRGTVEIECVDIQTGQLYARPNFNTPLFRALYELKLEI